MTKTECRKLYNQMETAMRAFEAAMIALRRDHEYTGTVDHFQFVNCDLFLMDAREALEQTLED